jgi:hypothetical protein
VLSSDAQNFVSAAVQAFNFSVRLNGEGVLEYSKTASVLSSCSGRGVFTSACIQAGASLAEAPGAIKAQNARAATDNIACTANRGECISVRRYCCARLQHDLLFIVSSHSLE